LKTVLFVCDAFRSSYISKKNTPFLFNSSRRGIYFKNIIPSGGFCERTEIFNGQKPKESGFFTAIGFDPENSPYKNKIFLSFLGEIELRIKRLLKDVHHPSKKRIELLLRKILIRIYFHRDRRVKLLKPYIIPLLFLKYFNLTEDEYDFFENSQNTDKSIFNDIIKSGNRSYKQSFTSLRMLSNKSDFDNLQNAVDSLNNDNYAFYPIYIGEIDQIGHLYGPHSKELYKSVAKLDSMIEQCARKFLEKDRNTKFVFLGDHGMTTVKKIIDIENIIYSLFKKMGLLAGRDYIYFLDSTMFRIWFIKPGSTLLLKNTLFSNQVLLGNGIFINKEIANAYSIPHNDRRYGDVIWWANSGVLIFPDYFHNMKPYKGMHGYRPDTKSTYGTCITWGKGIIKDYSEEQELIYVNDLIKEINSN
jgi:predicted AlkP superfamily pyrophosphatase or phosphodiesterase